MPSGNVPPPAHHPDEQPTVCVQINTDWIPILLGVIQPMKYPEYWSGTLEENRRARRDYGILYDLLMQAELCMPTNCCVELPVIERQNPDTGVIQISYDGGATWSQSPNTLQKYIPIPPPPVTSGVAGTKCDAATNVQTQVQAWIDQVLTDFDTATVLLDFAIAVADAILAAVLAILSAGALTVAEALILPALGAALTAVWGAGKVAFEDYWTPEALSTILCAAYCNISDDGSFSDEGFTGFWTKCNSDLSVGPAKMLFLGFISSVGKSGLSAMAASGTNADADCSDCEPCSTDFRVWVWDQIAAERTEIFPDEDGVYSAPSGTTQSGPYYVAQVSFFGPETDYPAHYNCFGLTDVTPDTVPFFKARCSDHELDSLATSVVNWIFYSPDETFTIHFKAGPLTGTH